MDIDAIRSAPLPKAWRGYARTAVDELVARLTDALEQLEERVRHLGAEIEAASAVRTELEQELQQTNAARDELARTVETVTQEREDFVAAIEEIKTEREARAAYTARLEQELGRYRELEQSLTGAIVSAERSGNDARAHADREALLVLEQARADARKIVYQASSERERLLADLQRIRSMLASAQAALAEPAFESSTEVPG
ncbi:MAG TPA: DivIVA domain-containing protein [Gaiellaceae bacterium]|nr:DivIVA domain-containing protein [Gaiellaceae bacterium]